MTEEGGASDAEESLGSVGEEAAKLFGALQDWARDAGAAQLGGLTEDLGQQLGDLGSHVAHGEDCRCEAMSCMNCTSVRSHAQARSTA